MLTFGKIKESKYKKGTRACIVCGEIKKIVGKDMCRKCYDKSRLASRLERYHTDEEYREQALSHGKDYYEKKAPLIRLKRVLRGRTEEAKEKARVAQRERREYRNEHPKETWVRYSACQECGTIERPHIARGLCSQCYPKKRSEAKQQKEQWLHSDIS